MAGAYRSSNSLAPNTRTNSTVTAPSGIQNNDILLYVLSVGGAAAITGNPPAGFTVATGFPMEYAQADPYTVRVYAWWKKASGESGNYTATHSSAFSEGFLAAYSGCDATPINPAPTILVDSDGGSTSDILTATGLTTANNGSVVVFVGGTWNAVGPATAPTGTTPTFTERYDGGSSGSLYVADGVLTTAGATGDKTLVYVVGHPIAAASLIALEADTGGGGGGPTTPPRALAHYRRRRSV